MLDEYKRDQTRLFVLLTPNVVSHRTASGCVQYWSTVKGKEKGESLQGFMYFARASIHQ